MALLQGLQAACWPSALLFRRALQQPARAQLRCLHRVLNAVKGSAQAARTPGFSRLRTAREFQDAFPLSTPESLRGPVESLAAGSPRVLTGEPVQRLELTGGSSGASKLVPMTAGLLSEFHRALAPTLFDLLSERPATRQGPSYWSISPLGQRQNRSAGGLPMGSVEDSAYFPRLFQPALRRIFAVPGAVAHLPDVESCRYVTLWHLVAREDLAFISVWNPSFLTLLMAALERHGERLADDLERGVCRPPPLEPPQPEREQQVQAVLSRFSFAPYPRQAQRLRAALQQGLQGRALWPQLAVLSLWTEAQAQRSLAAVQERFQGVEIQGKGLLATEGVVTLPLFRAPAPVLAVRSHFYEFQAAEHPEARPLLAHELTRGERYRVLLSTSGGFLRYQLGDLVQVEDFLEETPCLRFLGRADAVSDLVGEKLSVARVSSIFAQVLGPAFRFALLAPEWSEPPGYLLFLESAGSDDQLHTAAAAVEAALCEGHPYQYARALGQLAPVRALRVRDGARCYEARCLALGQRAGDIKPMDLHLSTGWKAGFEQWT